MPEFISQFSRVDPLEFKSFGTFDFLISWFASDARALLVPGRSVEQLTLIAQELEAVITECLQGEPKRNETTLDDLFVINDPSAPLDISERLPFPVKHWEPYAVFSLWKLIDALEISGWPDGGCDHPMAVAAINSNIVMAANALQCAHRIAGQRSGTITNKASEFESRSNQSRQSLRVRWQDRNEHLRFALSLIPKFEFKSRAKVARAIADEIQEEYGCTYGDETIDKWLKDANWSKENFGVSTP